LIVEERVEGTGSWVREASNIPKVRFAYTLHPQTHLDMQTKCE